MSAQADFTHPQARHLAARVGGAMLITGGSLALILLLIGGPGFANGNVAPALTTGSFAIAVGLVCLTRPSRVPSGVLPLLAPLGTVLIALASALADTTGDGSELLYMWPVLYTSYFLSIRGAFANVAFIGAIYTPISLRALGPEGITPSVYLVGTSIVTVLIVSSLRRQLNQLIAATELEARTDGLTGLANRRFWAEAVGREVAGQAQRGTPLSLLLFDLDHFKRLNDTHGHAAGDAALTRVAAVLREHMRHTEVLARLGGEEFALMLPDCDPDEAAHRAEEIRVSIRRASAEWLTPVTVSIGVAALPLHANTVDELMASADAAMYEAKRAGRDTVRVFEPTNPSA